MTTIPLPVYPKSSPKLAATAGNGDGVPAVPTIALVGNPNAGKTTLFNVLTGLRARTANFPGTTVDHRVAKLTIAGRRVELLDLPGMYSMAPTSPDEQVACDALRGRIKGVDHPDGVLLVLDATKLERSLFLAGSVLELGLPTVVAMNMSDLAQRAGIKTDLKQLAIELGCPVVAVSARSREGVDQLSRSLDEMIQRQIVADNPAEAAFGSAPACTRCGTCPYAARYDWAQGICDRCDSTRPAAHGRTTEAIDRVLTHPVIGVAAFFSVMAGMFVLIFLLADLPMTWIDQGFSRLGQLVSSALPPGDFSSLIVDGVIGGVGGVLAFLPQICILFFFITLLEDTGYLARAAFVMDRLMRRVGLPGRAFVPMLSAHACAIPGIMASRVIEDRRDRLVTILVLPLLTCSARLPVYAMLTALLFPQQPVVAGLLFAGAYTLGIVAALAVAFVLRRTILPGRSKSLVIELPCYKLPSLRTAVLETFDRSMMFVKRAGTIILLISIILWAATTYPKPPSELPASRVQNTSAVEYSIAGRLGKALEPVFAPLGFNWQINVGVISSFAAREAIVSALGVAYAVGEDDMDNHQTLDQTLATQTRPDGTPAFSTATCLSLLVFFVLAMQCLPTQVVTRRETGKWRWAFLQLGYMTVLAYSAALVTYQVATWFSAS